MVYRIVIDSEQIQGLEIKLLPAQNHYLRRVVRLKSGENFVAMDGQGNGWQAKLTQTGAEIITAVTDNRELPIAVTLIVALPKGNALENVIRCTTELGVNQILPVISERTLLKPSENKLERWRKIAIEAAEQCERQIVPYIAQPLPFFTAISHISQLNCPCYLAVARNQPRSLFSCLKNDMSDHLSGQIVIGTGSEGGWTSTEVEQAIACNFQPVSLGKRILRAVTAPIMAMSLVSAIYEDNLTNF